MWDMLCSTDLPNAAACWLKLMRLQGRCSAAGETLFSVLYGAPVPLQPEHVPNYRSIVKQPMDLGTVLGERAPAACLGCVLLLACMGRHSALQSIPRACTACCACTNSTACTPWHRQHFACLIFQLPMSFACQAWLHCFGRIEQVCLQQIPAPRAACSQAVGRAARLQHTL